MKVSTSAALSLSTAASCFVGSLGRTLQGLVEIDTDFNCLANCTATTNTTGDDCFKLTDDLVRQSGVVWSTEPIEISNSFVVDARLYFGINNSSSPDLGADGIGFVLQNQGANTVGVQGGGLGLSGIQPSLAVEFDTFQNPHDPSPDHIALLRDGRLTNGILDGPYNFTDNLENGEWWSVSFMWLSENSTIRVMVNGTEYLNTSPVNLTGILGSNFAYVGFTSSTGTSTNVHEVCVESVRGTVYQSEAPSMAPSVSAAPSRTPTLAPSVSSAPSAVPSLAPSVSSQPSTAPSGSPSISVQPSVAPSTGEGGKGKGGKGKGGKGKGGCRTRALKDGKGKKGKGGSKGGKGKGGSKGGSKADKMEDQVSDITYDYVPDCDNDDDMTTAAPVTNAPSLAPVTYAPTTIAPTTVAPVTSFPTIGTTASPTTALIANSTILSGKPRGGPLSSASKDASSGFAVTMHTFIGTLAGLLSFFVVY